MVKASTPMLNTKAPNEWSVTNLRIPESLHRYVRGLERHSYREGEIDEVPINGIRSVRKLEPRARRRRSGAVGEMRVVECVDHVAEQPCQEQGRDDQGLGERLRPLLHRLCSNRREQHDHHDPGQ
jgi:hypothetical protein